MLHALGEVQVSATPFLLAILAVFALCYLSFAIAAVTGPRHGFHPRRILRTRRPRAP